jgi:Fur family transcriptional regulator, ferric uptake regulator
MKPAETDQLRDVLRRAGLRATLPRVEVLRHLMQARAALSHGELCDRLVGRGLDRATVYRNLLDLTEVGLVRRTDVGDHVWRFELLSSGSGHREEEHPHFICSGCGVVACLPETVVSVRPGGRAPRALRRKGLAVQLRGLCDACA